MTSGLNTDSFFVTERYEGGGGRGGRRGDGDEGRRGGRGGRGGGRGGGRNNRDEDSHIPGQAKPSTNVSLFDFLEEKLPGDTETGKSKSAGPKGNGSNSHPVQERPLYQVLTKYSYNWIPRYLITGHI